MKEETISPRQLDAIREVVNIGAGHAATSLSALTNLRVMISIPRIQWTSEVEAQEQALPGGEPLVMISVPVVGSSDNDRERASLVLSEETAIRMVALMLRRNPDVAAGMGPMERSTLSELGNIVCAAYVGVLGNFLNKGIMIGTPELIEGTRVEIARSAPSGLLIETDFRFLDTTFEGVFVLSHAELSFAALLEALGLKESE